jgi:hypothetical protein
MAAPANRPAHMVATLVEHPARLECGTELASWATNLWGFRPYCRRKRHERRVREHGAEHTKAQIHMTWFHGELPPVYRAPQ